LSLDALAALMRELAAEVSELRGELAAVTIDSERLWRRIGRYCEQTGDSERTARRDIQLGVLEVRRVADGRRTYVRLADPGSSNPSNRPAVAAAAGDALQQMQEPPSPSG
jgi:hypothetical protein